MSNKETTTAQKLDQDKLQEIVLELLEAFHEYADDREHEVPMYQESYFEYSLKYIVAEYLAEIIETNDNTIVGQFVTPPICTDKLISIDAQVGLVLVTIIIKRLNETTNYYEVDYTNIFNGESISLKRTVDTSSNTNDYEVINDIDDKLFYIFD